MEQETVYWVTLSMIGVCGVSLYYLVKDIKVTKWKKYEKKGKI